MSVTANQDRNNHLPQILTIWDADYCTILLRALVRMSLGSGVFWEHKSREHRVE